ncbi:hypothetical protein JCM8115_001495 [Rhodotorula mucilaginosa]
MATAWGYGTAPFVSSGLAQGPIDRVSVNAATPPMTDSQLLPAPPPAAMLPPPPPARDLHGARARITLEKVKLEIESVRGVLGDVNGLGEAVKGLQNQVELLLAERAAQDQALEDRVKVAVQTACEEHTSKIKADLEAVSRRLFPASVDASKGRNSYNLRTADSLGATLRKDVEERFAQFETLLEKRLGSGGGANGQHSAQLGELQNGIESLSRTVDRQADVVRRLQEEVIGLGKRLDEKANGELKKHSKGAKQSANPPLGAQVTPMPALSSVCAADLTISAERRTVGAPAVDDKSTIVSSPSLPRPSPPRRKVPLRQLANSVVRPGAGTSPQQAANAGDATCAGTSGSAPERATHVGPFGLARSLGTSTSTTTTRMRICSPERQTPTRRRLLEPSEALTSSMGSSRTKTTFGPSPTLIAEEARRSIMQQQAAKRRRTIKQDESLGSPRVQQGEEAGYALMSDVVNEQGGAEEASGGGPAGAAGEELAEEHGSSSEGEPSTQE